MYLSGNCAEFDVRLSYRERDNATGNLEICLDNTWQSVCTEGINNLGVIDVACRSLGFNDFDGTEQDHLAVPPVVVQGELIVQNAFFCDGSEQSLFECLPVNQGQFEGSRVCTTQEDALRVQCLCKLLQYLKAHT